MAVTDEYIDLVNENDIVIGKELRNEAMKNRRSNIRVINILIFNSKRELLIPKRSANRRIFPNCYDFSVGGYVDSGETYIQTAYRELKEELGIDSVELEEIGYFRPWDINTATFSKLYRLTYDGKLDYDKDGIDSIHYFSLPKLKTMLDEDVKAFKGDMPPIIGWYIEKYGF